MSNPPNVNLLEKRDVGQVINASFLFLRVNFKPLYKDLLLIAAPFYLLAGIFAAAAQFNLLEPAIGYRSGFAQFAIFFSPMYYVNLLLLLIGWSLSFCIVGHHVRQYRINRGPGYDLQAVKDGIRKDFLRIIIANFLNGMIIVAASVLLIIPGIYLAVANSLISVILILNDNKDIVDSFSESRRMVKDNWWRTLGLILLVAFIIYGISFVFTLPMVVISFIIGFHSVRGGDIEDYRLMYIIFSSIGQIGYALVSPISVIATCIYYYSLKEAKDHVGLMESIDKIGVQPTVNDKDEGSY